LGHAIINLQAITGLAFLVILLVRTRPADALQQTVRLPWGFSVLAIVTLPLLLFGRTLALPFTHDTCGLVWLAAHQSFTDILHLLAPPPMPPDFFFRPLAYGAFWIYAKWAHLEPVRWNAWCLGMHIVNCLLVYALARQLAFKPLGATVAALLFALHGTRAEAVAWPPVRVDLLATFFVLLTLLAVNKVAGGESRWWFISLVITAAGAFLSKEAAYGLPLIAWAMLYGRTESKKLPVVVTLSAVCAACFFYRMWVLGGIGGYGTAEGKPAALHFSLLRLINGLFYRQWAFLFFPVNWSEQPELALWCGMTAMAAVLLAAALFWPAGERRILLSFLAMTVAAALPAYQLLFLSPDLNGARVLYLPVLGLALFWGAVIQAQSSIRRQIPIAIGLLLFQGTALTHNLRIWSEGSLLAQRAYREMSAEFVKGAGLMGVENLPATWKGVFFLKNSFPACVFLNSGGILRDMPDIREIPMGAPMDGFGRVYRWNDQTLVFDKLK
jgi:hypothetical protein